MRGDRARASALAARGAHPLRSPSAAYFFCFAAYASAAATTAKVALAAVLVPLAAVAYVVAVDRFPHYREWIATASLVLSHAQVVGFLGSLAALDHLSLRVSGALKA